MDCTSDQNLKTQSKRDNPRILLPPSTTSQDIQNRRNSVARFLTWLEDIDLYCNRNHLVVIINKNDQTSHFTLKKHIK